VSIVRVAPGVVPLLLAVASCDSPTPPVDPAPSLTGSYVLVGYNGHQVPVDLGPIPGKIGEVTECHIIVTGGELTLNEEVGTFQYHYELRSSCNQGLLSNPSMAGTVVREGAGLVFTIQQVDGPLQFPGTVVDGCIVIHQLEYQRVLDG